MKNKNFNILNDLPKWKSGKNKGQINRKAMVGMELDIEYYGCIYKIKIIDYVSKK